MKDLKDLISESRIDEGRIDYNKLEQTTRWLFNKWVDGADDPDSEIEDIEDLSSEYDPDFEVWDVLFDQLEDNDFDRNDIDKDKKAQKIIMKVAKEIVKEY